mmetsp:Transcript_2374/g.3813  ORF Transcript_2374/g.3813 Transcript_2374/m.3813 type:complete len:169 (+) Transcript_2374:63-569(+)
MSDMSEVSEVLVEKAGAFEKLISDRRAQLESLREQNKALVKSLLISPPTHESNGSVIKVKEPISTLPQPTNNASELERRYLYAFMHQGQNFNREIQRLHKENAEIKLELRRGLRNNTFLLLIILCFFFAFFARSSPSLDYTSVILKLFSNIEDEDAISSSAITSSSET